MFKKISFIVAFALCVGLCSAQTFEVPVSVTLEKPGDFDYFNDDIKACVDWLIKTPFGTEEAKRKQASAFLFQWISGHPAISILFDAKATPYTKKNPELFFIFMGGWAKYMIDHPEDLKDMVKGNVAGIRAVVQAYKTNTGVKKDKEVETFVKLDADGKLEEWVKANIATESKKE